MQLSQGEAANFVPVGLRYSHSHRLMAQSKMVGQTMDGVAQSKPLRHERRGAVLLLIMAAKPVNALAADLRRALSAGFDAAEADATVRAVVICSDLGSFSAGADLAELSRKGIAPPSIRLDDLCLRIERFSKPVVAALNGQTLGAGLSLALSAKGRIAAPQAALGFPDVGLGAVPEAGGIQRLTARVGVPVALRMLLEPGAISAAQALTVGLVDAVAETDLRRSAVALAERLVDAPQQAGPRRDGKAAFAAIAAARLKVAHSHLPAPLRAIECVEAAQLLPLEQALAFDAAAHDDLIRSAQAQGLRHAFLAERRASAAPAALAAHPADCPTEVAIWGAGAGAADLAAQALAAGLRVSVIDANRETLASCLSIIATRQEQAVTEGRQSAEARDADWARLSSSVGPERLATAEIIFAGPDAGPVPMNSASVVNLGALPARAAAGKIALIPAVASGLVAEVSMSAEASVPLAARLLALGRKFGWRVIFTGAGGPIDKRLRASLSAAISHMESNGLARSVIAAAIGSYGIGVSPRGPFPEAPPEAEGILQACIAALANQGSRLLADAVARRPSDIDAVAVLGGLFPRWQGGPMFQADRQGLLVMRADLIKRAQSAPQLYAPDPLWDELIANGQDFGTMNGAA